MQYHDWVDNAWLRIFALSGLLNLGNNFIKADNHWTKAVGWIWTSIVILLYLLFLYKLFKSWPYQEKVKTCEHKIAKIDYQIAKELGGLEFIEKNLIEIHR